MLLRKRLEIRLGSPSDNNPQEMGRQIAVFEVSCRITDESNIDQKGRGAHISFEAAVKDFPLELAGQRVPRLEHTDWGLVYHLRIAQWDILEYARGGENQPPLYPSGYWPQTDGPQDAADWEQAVRSFGRDLKALQRMVRDPQHDLYAPLRPDSD
jgi:hypothetical protein